MKLKKTSEEPKTISWGEFWDAYSKDNPDPRKAECAKCKYKEKLVGDAHIACTSLGARGILQALTGEPPTADTKFGKIPLVYANEIGIRKGYFMWPFNFDPFWLWWCFLFEAKDEH